MSQWQMSLSLLLKIPLTKPRIHTYYQWITCSTSNVFGFHGSSTVSFLQELQAYSSVYAFWNLISNPPKRHLRWMWRQSCKLLFYCFSIQRFGCLKFIFYNVGTPILYRHVAFAHPHAFDRFLKSIEKRGLVLILEQSISLGLLLLVSVVLTEWTKKSKCLHLVLFSVVWSCVPTSMNSWPLKILNKTLTSTYWRSSTLCPTFKLLTFAVLLILLCRCYCPVLWFFKNENGEYIRTQDPQALEYYSRPILNITRLSLHGCSTLPANVIAALIQRLPNLSRLDLTHTQITSSCLHSISSSASLSHLSISKCALLSSNETAQFFLFHPAVRHLKWLNMMYEGTRPSPLSRESVALIVNSLPPLEYLNLHGLPVENLQPLINMNLISLSLGYANIPLDIIKRLLAHLPNLEYLDLTGNPNINIWTVQDTTLLNSNTNIRMFEFNRDLLAKLDGIVILDLKLPWSRPPWLDFQRWQSPYQQVS